MTVMDSPSCLFVAGPPRCGTTLCTMVLSAHSDICLSPETSHISWLLKQTGDPVDNAKFASFCQHIRSDVKLQGLGIPWQVYASEVEASTCRNRRQLVGQYLCFYRDHQGQGARVVGQKKDYLDCWKTLKTVLPHAKLLVIFRDPRAACLSAARKLPGQSLLSAARLWSRRRKAADQFGRAFPDDLYELNYEQFVQNPEVYCREICSFVGLSFEDAMLHPAQYNRHACRISRGERKKHARTATPISAAQIHAWRQQISPLQLEVVELVSAVDMRNCGYELESGIHCKPLRRAWLRILLAAKRLPEVTCSLVQAE